MSAVLARKAFSLDPNVAMAARVLACAEYRTRHWAERVSAVDRAMALKQDDATLWFMAAVAHWHKGDKNQAGTWFDKAAGAAKQNASENDELHELWTEAARLLGQPGPDPGNRLVVLQSHAASNWPSTANQRRRSSSSARLSSDSPKMQPPTSTSAPPSARQGKPTKQSRTPHRHPAEGRRWRAPRQAR